MIRRCGTSEESMDADHKEEAELDNHQQGVVNPKYTPLGLGIQLEKKADFFTNSRTIKRSIPILAAIFVAIVIWGVISQGYGQYDAIKGSEKNRVALLGTVIAQNIAAAQNADAANSILPVAPSVSELKSSFPKNSKINSQTILVVDADGIITASTPETVGFVQHEIGQILNGANVKSINDLSAYDVPITLTNGNEVFAQKTEIKGHNLTVYAFQKLTYIEQLWWVDIGTSLSLAVVSTFVLILMTFGFLMQMAHSSRAEEIIEATGNHLNRTLDRGRSGLWDWDIARGHVFWSSSMFDILGLKKFQHVLSFGEIKSILHDEDKGIIDELNELIQSGGKVFDREFRMLNSDNEWVWLHIRGEIVDEEFDSTIRLVGVTSDISEQKAIEARSHLADLHLSQAIENISEGFVMWDNDRRMVMCNKKFREFFKLPLTATRLGTHQDDVFAAGQEIMSKNVIALDDYSDDQHSAYEYLLQDGRWLHVSERVTNNGSFVSVGTDISHIKRHESKLVESERELLETVSHLEISQKKLESQQGELQVFAERANSANRAKTEFLANMSHELRTPLNAIIGFSELIQSQTFGEIQEPRYLEYANDIHKSGHHLLLVINDILDMSKIESGNMQLELQKVELAEVAESCLRIVSGRASDQNVVLDMNIKDGLYINADKRALKQILLNLLSNAVKFSDDGGQVTLNAGSSTDGINIQIADNGIGMSPESLANVGKPFAQVGSQLTKNHDGTGLGLSISKSLTEMHGGSLNIASEVDKGTLVSLDLPQYKKVKTSA